MLRIHVASGLLIAIASALWGLFAGYSGLACLALYVLGGNVGMIGSAALHIVKSSRRDSTESK